MTGKAIVGSSSGPARVSPGAHSRCRHTHSGEDAVRKSEVGCAIGSTFRTPNW
jgi:hypothetical protein